MQIDIAKERQKEFTKIWKQKTLVDAQNNFVFVPEFSPKKKGELFSKISMNNGVEG
eukprot:CAMPEP_0202974358 /NCGR_PEP_ID=MMETSP1396-20130829/59766_1 /ASSEMBLY_ACC=CAM_ASM_000872 /TAXON_ID= /ORGANISM="Pseudokeronopsis sp., Strain Brazil" /LENGTH=55 /DNA_ID=CAMNT_0049708035 /DNA_START=1 /DNA_END=164 /DNA_ORIENTATION=+